MLEPVMFDTINVFPWMVENRRGLPSKDDTVRRLPVNVLPWKVDMMRQFVEIVEL